MKLPYLIDFHMHSTVSDGTDSPEALLQRVRAAGIGYFSLTDHDAVQGCARILAVRKPDDPAFLPGVFSVRRFLRKLYLGAGTGSFMNRSIFGCRVISTGKPAASSIFPAVKDMGSPSGRRSSNVSPGRNPFRCVR